MKRKFIISSLSVILLCLVFFTVYWIYYTNNYKVGDYFVGLPFKGKAYISAYFGESIDLDKDGRLEEVFYVSTHMTKSPHIAYIVKDSRIIFKYTGAKVLIMDMPNDTGFILNEWEVIDTNEVVLTSDYLYNEGSITKTKITY